MRLEDDERCYHEENRDSRRYRDGRLKPGIEPLTITELAIETACAIYVITIFVVLIAIAGAR